MAGITHQASLQQPTPVSLAGASSSPNIAAEQLLAPSSSPGNVHHSIISTDGDSDQNAGQEVQVHIHSFYKLKECYLSIF